LTGSSSRHNRHSEAFRQRHIVCGHATRPGENALLSRISTPVPLVAAASSYPFLLRLLTPLQGVGRCYERLPQEGSTMPRRSSAYKAFEAILCRFLKPTLSHIRELSIIRVHCLKHKLGTRARRAPNMVRSVAQRSTLRVGVGLSSSNWIRMAARTCLAPVQTPLDRFRGSCPPTTLMAEEILFVSDGRT